jgi:hypothetical protein
MDIGDLGYPVRARFGGQTTPVKSARLVFSEEFNGASGGRRTEGPEVGDQRSEVGKQITDDR